MDDKDEKRTLCKSFFKNGKNVNKTEFTKAWIKLINILEKSKNT